MEEVDDSFPAAALSSPTSRATASQSITTAGTHAFPPQDSSSPFNNAGGVVLSPNANRIPKKSQSHDESPTFKNNNDTAAAAIDPLPASPTKQQQWVSNNPSDDLVLPHGVHLPTSVTPQIIGTGRLKQLFFTLSPSQMNEALVEYDVAVKEKGGEIRNRQAYLFGVVKRYKALHERSGGNANHASPQGKELSNQVLVRYFLFPYYLLLSIFFFP